MNRFFQMIVVSVLVLSGAGCVSSFPLARVVITNGSSERVTLSKNGVPIDGVFATGSQYSEDLSAPYRQYSEYVFTAMGYDPDGHLVWIQDYPIPAVYGDSNTIMYPNQSGPRHVYPIIITTPCCGGRNGDVSYWGGSGLVTPGPSGEETQSMVPQLPGR